MRNGDNFSNQTKQDFVPDEVGDELKDNLGWLADMNRPSKEHSTFVQDIKLKEDLQRINLIMKKII
jgi:hypothetical protein